MYKGLDRSIAAWGGLLRAFPAWETETLGLLVSLERLRRARSRSSPRRGLSCGRGSMRLIG